MLNRRSLPLVWKEAAIQRELPKDHGEAIGPYGTQSVEPPRATGSEAGVWVAVAAAWAVGFISNFLVAPTNTGLDVVASYAAFEPGSNVGNVGALTLWTAVSVRAAWHFSRSTGAFAGRVLAGFGLSAVLSLYPSAVVSHAVGHVVPMEDGFVYDGWLALPLAIAGGAALVAAATVVLISHRR